MDPFTALAAIKAAVSAGQELVNVTRQIGEFFDGVDDLRNKHNKKKKSAFSGSDENAMETFVQLQRARDAEDSLRELVIHLRGFSAWAELQEIRARVRRERKERQEAEALRKAELTEALLIWGGSGILLTLIIGLAIAIILGSQGKI